MKTCFASNWTSRFRSEKNDFRNFIRSRDVLHLNLLLHFLDLCSTFCLGVLESSSFVLWNWNAEKVWKDDNNLRLITSRWPWTSFHSLPGLSNPQNVQINRHQDGKIEAWDSCWIIPRNVRSDDVCIIDHNWWQMRMSDKWHLTSSICKSSASHQVFLWWLVSFFFSLKASRDTWWQVVTCEKLHHDSVVTVLSLSSGLQASWFCQKESHRSEEVTNGKHRDKSNLRRRISCEFPVMEDPSRFWHSLDSKLQAGRGSNLFSTWPKHIVNPSIRNESAKDKTTEKERQHQKCNIKTISRHVFFKCF